MLFKFLKTNFQFLETGVETPQSSSFLKLLLKKISFYKKKLNVTPTRPSEQVEHRHHTRVGEHLRAQRGKRTERNKPTNDTLVFLRTARLPQLDGWRRGPRDDRHGVVPCFPVESAERARGPPPEPYPLVCETALSWCPSSSGRAVAATQRQTSKSSMRRCA
jgi:hypothetical protein